MTDKDSFDILQKEWDALEVLRKIAWDLDSPNLGTLYDAVGRLAASPNTRLLLPKSMDLLSEKDRNIKQAAFTVSGKNAYGKYLNEFFTSLKIMNPVEREQILQGIEEMFNETGGPTSSTEQKNWITNLETLGREHQSAVFALMTSLGVLGKAWITKQIRENIKGISLGAVPPLSMFLESDRKTLINILCKKAAKERRDLLPYICGIIDQKTQRFLAPFLRKSTWQERVEIAAAIASTGIISSTGIVMELVADTKWQVKQSLLENLKIEDSKLTALMTVLSHLLAESHTRVRAQAERTLLLLGNQTCSGIKLKEQRKKLEKKFRTQLLKAVQANKDIDVSWLGIEREQGDPMVDILKRVTVEDENIESVVERDESPEGVSLADFTKETVPETDEKMDEEEKSALLSALLGAKKDVTAETLVIDEIDTGPLLLDPSLPATSRFILTLQRLSEEVGKDVPLGNLMSTCIDSGMNEEEFNKALGELEEQGIVYRSSKGTVSYVDIEL